MFKGHGNFKRAFTLYELMIAIALFALVAGVVLTFVSFMGRNVENSDYSVVRNSETLDIREELDFWFSAFDKQDYTFSTDGTAVVSAMHTDGTVYSVTFVTSVVDGNVVPQLRFGYPESIYHGETVGQFNYVYVDCTTVSEIDIVAYPDSLANVSGSVRFEINCPVSQLQFLCLIVFK